MNRFALVVSYVPVLLGLVLVSGAGCGSGKSAQGGGGGAKVTARVARVDMKEPQFGGVLADVVIQVDNQSSKEVVVEGAQVEVRLGGGGGSAGDAEDVEDEAAPEAAEPTAAGSPGFKGAMEARSRAAVAPGGKAYVPVEVRIEYPKETAAFIAFSQLEIAKLDVVGAVSTSAGEVTFKDDTEFPTPKLLRGEVKDAQMASIDQGAAGDVTLELVLANPNPFPVRAESWDLKLVVAGKELKQVQLAQGELIQANAGVGYSEAFKIDKENWGPDYKDVLKLPKVPWEVTGSISVRDSITYPFQTSGSMKFHR
jgi:hypothetical protein